MRRLLFLLALSSPSLFGYASFSGWCEQGGVKVQVQGQTSSTLVQQSYPNLNQSGTGPSVTVYLPGTTTKATLYSDNAGTHLDNSFPCSTKGQYLFFAADATYDLLFSGTGISSFTRGSIQGVDPLHVPLVMDYVLPSAGGGTFAVQCAAALAANVYLAVSKVVPSIATSTCGSAKVWFLPGGQLQVAAGQTLTMAVPNAQEGQRIFDTSASGASVALTGPGSLPVGWWSAGVSDETAGIQAALNAGTGRTVIVTSGSHRATAQINNTTCANVEWVPGGSITFDSGMSASDDGFRVVGPCSNFHLSNVTLNVQSGTPGRYGLNLDATGGVVSYFHISIGNIDGFGTGAITTTFPSGTDGIFDGVFDGGGTVRGTVKCNRCGDSLVFRDLLIAGTGYGFDVNQVAFAGILTLDHTTIVSCWPIRILTAFKMVVSNSFIEPANSCAGSGPASDALIDIAGTSSSATLTTNFTMRDSLINGTPTVATYLSRVDYATDVLIAGTQLNLGTNLQRGVRLTTNSVNTTVVDPSFPGTATHLISNPALAGVAVKYTQGGIAKMGPKVSVESPDGTSPVVSTVVRSTGQNSDLMQVLDENGLPLLIVGYTGTVAAAAPYYLHDNAGTSRMVLSYEPAANIVNICAVEAPGSGGQCDIYSNGAKAVRIYNSKGVSIGQFTDPGTGGLSVAALKTTGAAGSKKVVCVDTSTGILYASSTGTDCSN